jgi:hypothetical protein
MLVPNADCANNGLDVSVFILAALHGHVIPISGKNLRIMETLIQLTFFKA